jgi:hypothetical protein
LLCPLARRPHHAQQPQGAKNSGIAKPNEAQLSRFVSGSESQADIAPPTVLGGYRRWGCQVAEDAGRKGLNAKANLRE